VRIEKCTTLLIWARFFVSIARSSQSGLSELAEDLLAAWNWSSRFLLLAA